MANCKNCGKELKENAKFCGGCGTKVEILLSVKNKKKQEKKFHITGLFVFILLAAIILTSVITVLIYQKIPEFKNFPFPLQINYKNPAANSIIAAANVKNYDKPIKGVIFVEEGANLNLRPCPQASDNCEAIDKISPDTEVSILGETADGEWYKIKYQNLTGFANSKFVIGKESWNNGIRRSYIGILDGADVYDSDYGKLVLISIKDIYTGQLRRFSAFYENYPNIKNFLKKKVKILIDKEGLVEKIELANEKITTVANGKITRSSLVGIWKLESVENVSRVELSSSVEYFKDGTGIAYYEQLYGAGMPFKWQLKDGNRLQLDMNGIMFIYDIDLSENGTLLTTYIDGRNFEGKRPRKTTERKIKKQ
ncbi:MAG: SH3 domain-containing protein [Chitinivibrionia bacterium]|nr:SH3 domain-containing protein [Chitinivibrionia bacterium]